MPIRPTVVLCALFTVSACAGELEDPERFEVGAQPLTSTPPGSGSTPEVPVSDGGVAADECPDVVADILIPRCASAGCHDATSAASGLDLASDGIRERLLDVQSASCSDYLLIDSADPASSFLGLKLSASPPCGLPMPLGGTLSNADVACVMSWLSEG